MRLSLILTLLLSAGTACAQTSEDAPKDRPDEGRPDGGRPDGGRPDEAEPAPAKLREVKARRGLRYGAKGEPEARQLDLFVPAGEAAPLFVYVHGGAWVSGSRRQYGHIGASLAQRGVACAILGYRLTRGAETAHPAAVEDVAAALAWLSKQRELGYDPARIVVGGHSAGAHMSALLALDKRYLEAAGASPALLRGVVGLEGIYDIPKLIEVWPGYESQFIGEVFGARERWAAASPQTYAAAGPGPWLLVHSPDDELVDVPQTRRFAEALSKAGGRVELWLEAPGQHFEVVEAIGGEGDVLTERLADFVLRVTSAGASGR